MPRERHALPVDVWGGAVGLDEGERGRLVADSIIVPVRRHAVVSGRLVGASFVGAFTVHIQIVGRRGHAAKRGSWLRCTRRNATLRFWDRTWEQIQCKDARVATSSLRGKHTLQDRVSLVTRGIETHARRRQEGESNLDTNVTLLCCYRLNLATLGSAMPPSGSAPARRLHGSAPPTTPVDSR